jgi:hypothetical protein
LEPYRLLVGCMLVGWILSLLADPRVRFRKSGLGGPLLLYTIAAVGSIIVNGQAHQEPIKALVFFGSFLLVFSLIISVVRTSEQIDFLVRILVSGGTVVALAAIYESRTHYNVFDHLSSVMPFLHLGQLPYLGSDGRNRVYASAQDHISMGAAFVMLIPLAVYLARRHGQRRWWACAALLGMSALSTSSRTSVIMLVVVGLVLLRLRTGEMKRFWPALIPVLAAVHLVLPGTIGSMAKSFFPKGGLVAQQKASAGTIGSGRLADIGPGIRMWTHHPLVGQGLATLTVDPTAGPNQVILDDQWLGTLIETGLLGLLGWLWIFGRSIRDLNRKARGDPTNQGWLPASLSASIAAYAVGMLTFDAMVFIQVTFLLFIMLALGRVVVGESQPPPLQHSQG